MGGGHSRPSRSDDAPAASCTGAVQCCTLQGNLSAPPRSKVYPNCSSARCYEPVMRNIGLYTWAMNCYEIFIVSWLHMGPTSLPFPSPLFPPFHLVFFPSRLSLSSLPSFLPFLPFHSSLPCPPFTSSSAQLTLPFPPSPLSLRSLPTFLPIPPFHFPPFHLFFFPTYLSLSLMFTR